MKMGDSSKSGDMFNLSGDFRGAILNIKSTLREVQQSVGDIRTGDEAARQELHSLVEALNQALQQAPPEKQEDAQAVAETARVLIDSAKADKPNKTMVQITGEGLKQAAQNLADVMPAVLGIASQIVITVMRITGGMK
jgi:methyl-accepting chemotaxis protein